MSFNQYEALNKRGLAAGHSNIRTDSIDFFFEGEELSFPTIAASLVAKWNGYFYVAKIDDLRKLEAEQVSG